MPLKNIDKYIKDKLQGYKPAYQEDLWKGIEEKLPPSRVPNGNGSWLIMAAAAIVIIALIPAMLKINNVADRRSEIARIHNELANMQDFKNGATIPGKGLQKNEVSHIAQQEPTQALQPSDPATDQNTGPNNLRHINDLNNRGNNHGLQKNTARRGRDIHNPLNQEAINENVLNENPLGLALNKESATLMNHLSPAIEMAGENEGTLQIKTNPADQEIGRYNDRGSNSKYARWANWQSIFSPFWKNPAYTGSEGKFNVTVDDKIDYDNNNSPLNYHNNFAFDVRLPVLGLGIGVYHSRDLSPYSLQSTTGLALSKVLFHAGATSVKLGVAGTIINNSLFFNALNYPDQIDPVLGIRYATQEKDPVAMTQAFGLNAGLWLSGPHVMAGIDVENLNTPHLEHISEAAPLPRVWRGTLGYRLSVSKALQFMPMAVFTRKSTINQANGTLTAVYKDKYMVSVAYQDISPTTGRGNLLAYAGVDIKKQLRVFASYGRNLELAEIGVNESFLHIGFKFQIP
jgi:hypothetical protein